MKGYSIAVYAICKNKEKFVDKWLEAMSEADEIYVTDIGSEDNTVERLISGGANVQTAELPKLRFDTARNISLGFVPANVDICVAADLDETFDKGWRELLENVWERDTSRLMYTYTWNIASERGGKVVFTGDKIHSRKGFRWVYPVHEVLMYEGEGPYNCVTEPRIHLNRFSEPLSPQTQYMELLTSALKEEPDNAENAHYLGRELMFYGKWNKSIEVLKMHLKMPSAAHRDERAASMRYIARCYRALGNYKEAEGWLYRAIAEAPYTREPYMEMAFLAYELKKWYMVYAMTTEALRIKEKSPTYINESFCWDSTPYYMVSAAALNMGIYKKADKYTEETPELSPE